MQCPLRLLPLAGAVMVAGLQPAVAQDDEPIERVPERCITLTRVDRTEVVDDRTIIFHMRGGGVFLNHLSRECPGLKREERFMYSPTSNRLCDVDTVTVLESGGFGLTRGFTCALGMFHPITDIELAELQEQKDRGEDGAGGFEVEQVEPEVRDAEPADEGRDGDAADDAPADAEDDGGA